MMDLWRIGKHLKAARKAKTLTQAQVSQETKLDRAIVSRIENGKFSGSVKCIERYANYLGLQLMVEPKCFPQLDELSILFDD